MSNHRYLSCYRALATNRIDFHPGYYEKTFGTMHPPELPYSKDQMSGLAEKVIKSQVAVTGVQLKLSLTIEKPTGEIPKRFTIVGVG